MKIVLSGEGRSDLGQCTNQQGECQTPDFAPGPMTWLVDRELEQRLCYSPLECTPHQYHYISEAGLQVRAQVLRAQQPRALALTGKKRGQETGFFHRNAWMLGQIALEFERKEGDSFIAVLFRDSDGTRNTASSEYQDKYESMRQGFLRAGLGIRGVPMLPRPKSEAWLLCAIQNKYQHCAALENLPGTDDAPRSAKRLLAEALGDSYTTSTLNDWIAEHGFDGEQVAHQMPSYAQFRADLHAAYTAATSAKPDTP